MKISNIIREHQLATFFVITYAITWGFWIPLGRLYHQENLTIAAGFMTWGAFGPALAGIIITQVTTPRRNENSLKASIIAFLFGLIVSALIIFIVEWPPENVGTLVIVSLIAAIPPSCVISSTFSRNQNVRQYLSSLRKPCGAIIYYLIALLIQPFTFWIGSVISNILGLSVYATPTFLTSRGWEAIIIILILFIYQFFYGNVLGEEVGWRGFALPRLQTRFSPLFSSLVIASIWFPWHLPLKLMNPDVLPYVFYGLTFFPQSIILTWIYNRTGGSILAVGIAHVSSNISGKFLFPITDGWLVAKMLMAIIFIISDRMWQKNRVITFSSK